MTGLTVRTFSFRLAVDGPFGTATEDIFSYEVDIFVAAGIMTDFSIPLLYSRYSKTCLKRPLKNRQNKCLKDKW